MESTELEEGEACSFRNDNNATDHTDFDVNMDPDIALSYIDEKLEHVLGHLQKEFEGGLSAENLGPKFGGYGSFLPTYQRSPVWSHSRTPPKNNLYVEPRLPNNLQLEGVCPSLVTSSTAPQLIRPEHGPTSAASSAASKASSSVAGLVKQEKYMSSTKLADEVAPTYDTGNKTSANLSDTKLLKVRIRLGSDNQSTRKNTAIYSDPGLDISPSSALEESPLGSDGLLCEAKDSPFESPGQILQIMLSLPLHGSLLLSPLPDDLLQLTENGRPPEEIGLLAVSRVGPGSSGAASNDSDIKANEKVLREKKMRSFRSNEIPAELNSEKSNDPHDVADVPLKRQMVDNTSASVELVSDTLNLPLRSNYHSALENTTKAMGSTSKEAVKRVGRDKSFSDATTEKPFKEDSLIDNAKTASSKVMEDTGARKAEKPYDSVENESNTSKEGKNTCIELTNSLKQKACQQDICDDPEGANLASGKVHSSSEGKKKSKGSYNCVGVATDVSKESLTVGSSPMAKSKKSARADDRRSKVEGEPLNSQNNNGKASDRYREFFGDMDVEQEESQMTPSEIIFNKKAKDSIIFEKSTNTTNTSNERINWNNANELLSSEVYPVASSTAPPSGYGAISDTAPAVINDNWVSCDKCMKWRLLPHGINPKDLPDKWLCSMMYWLPGRNHCGTSEDETNNVIASFQVPPVEGQRGLQSNHCDTLKITTVDTRQSDDNHRNFGSHVTPTVVKKKHSSKELSNSTYAGPSRSSSSMKKTIRSSVADGIPNDLNQPALSNELDSLRVTTFSNLAVEGQRYKKQEKHKSSENFLKGGIMKHSKFKGNRETDQDCDRASKKLRTEGLPEDLMFDYCSDKVDPRSIKHLDKKKLPKYADSASNDTKHSKKEQVHLYKRKDEAQILRDNGSLDIAKHANGDVVKKRKAKGSHDTGNDLQVGKNDDRKKARLSRSDEKVSSRTENNGSQRKNQQLRQNPRVVSQQRSDGNDSFRRDSGSLPSTAAATSSSSKVSDSHKTKADLQDTKGSPVESVSSSPMRAFKPGNCLATRGNLAGKDGFINAGVLGLDDKRSCSEGGSIVGIISGKERQQKIPDADVANHGSLEASIPDLQDNDYNHVSSVRARSYVETSTDRRNHQFSDGGADDLAHNTQLPTKSLSSNQLLNDEMENDNDHFARGSHSRTSGKGFPLRSKDKIGNFSSEFNKGRIKVSELVDGQVSFTVKPTDNKCTVQEKFTVNSDESVNKCVDNKDSGKTPSKEFDNRENQSGGTSCIAVKGDATCNGNTTYTPKKSSPQDCKTVASEGKLTSLPLSAKDQNDALGQSRQSLVASGKGKKINNLSADVATGNNTSKALKETKSVDLSNGTHPNTSKHPLPNGQRARDFDAPSPIKRDSSSQAANNALKEAKDLKHVADRLKNAGSYPDCARFYFEASLKFLHGASLLETCSSENAKTGEMNQSMQIYSSTAKFCEFCAREYEKCKDIAAAALAYKCAEVAYLRVINSSYTYANRDRHQLQMALQMIPPGESPSSSASDVDNMNHSTSGDKVHLVKGITSPQVTGSHVISAQNRPNFVRVLNFVQDVNSAMEASRKSWAAFAAANVNLGEAQSKEMNSIKTALDFGFQDIEGLLRVMRLASEAITR